MDKCAYKGIGKNFNAERAGLNSLSLPPGKIPFILSNSISMVYRLFKSLIMMPLRAIGHPETMNEAVKTWRAPVSNFFISIPLLFNGETKSPAFFSLVRMNEWMGFEQSQTAYLQIPNSSTKVEKS